MGKRKQVTLNEGQTVWGLHFFFFVVFFSVFGA